MLLRRIPVAVGVAGLLALPAAPAQAGPSPQDADYLKAAHQVNLAEIAAGRIAWTTTHDPTVKGVAAALMRDHIRLDADLYQTARQLRVYLPAAPTPEQQALVKRYEAAGADTFDEYFISTQLAAHRTALKMTAEQAEKGSEESVKDLAARAEPVIAHHRTMLRDAAEAEGLAGYVDTGGRHG
jgi:putative membrane protein